MRDSHERERLRQIVAASDAAALEVEATEAPAVDGETDDLLPEGEAEAPRRTNPCRPVRDLSRPLYASDLAALIGEVLRQDCGIPGSRATKAARAVAGAVLERYPLPRVDPLAVAVTQTRGPRRRPG